MSRLAKKPLTFKSPVKVELKDRKVLVSGGKLGAKVAEYPLPEVVEVSLNGNELLFSQDAKHYEDKALHALLGTTLARVRALLQGAAEGYKKSLTLVGVGYRAQAAGQKLNLSLGFSHPVEYAIPEGITITTPSQTEIVVEGVDKELVGKVAADIRDFRRPEPYQGKGVRYTNERVLRKETKKKK